MRVLDLFCGGGGSSMGMYQAGAEHITGVDIEYQLEYPGNDLFHSESFTFIQEDVMCLDPEFMLDFDFIWASPPCQAYSCAGRHWRKSGKEYDDLVGLVREILHYSLDEEGIPFVIENVPGAPIKRDLMLCGVMFDLHILRHRIFEFEGFDCSQPEHIKHKGTCIDGSYVTVAGTGGNDKGHNYEKLNDLPGANQLKTWQYAMGIPWIANKKTLRECVPPLYAKYIMTQFMKGRE